MKSLSFPVFKTKSPSGLPRFGLNDPQQRTKYFQFKAGSEIAKIKKYLQTNTFLAILLGKKAAGKGTRAKMFMEVIGKDRVDHIPVGDIIRQIDEEVRDPQRLKKLKKFLEANYRGWHSLAAIIKAQKSRSTKKLLPTEFVLALLKREIARRKKKAIFIDGFPRDLDQISYSLFFRDLIDYRDDPDFFILIDVSEKVIDERIKSRVVCPRCQTPRNLRLLPTKEAGYDPEKKEFYLICDNPICQGARMIAKEGDELGIGPIRERLEKDEKLIHQAFSLYGIPKILLRNGVPVKEAKKYVDDYEITPEYVYHWDKKKQKVRIEEKPWVVKDDEGISSYSLLPAPDVVSLIKQLADLL